MVDGVRFAAPRGAPRTAEGLPHVSRTVRASAPLYILGEQVLLRCVRDAILVRKVPLPVAGPVPPPGHQGATQRNAGAADKPSFRWCRRGCRPGVDNIILVTDEAKRDRGSLMCRSIETFLEARGGRTTGGGPKNLQHDQLRLRPAGEPWDSGMRCSSRGRWWR